MGGCQDPDTPEREPGYEGPSYQVCRAINPATWTITEAINASQSDVRDAVLDFVANHMQESPETYSDKDRPEIAELLANRGSADKGQA